MFRKNANLLKMAGLFLGVLFIGQGTGLAQTTAKNVKLVTIPHSQPYSGKQMYKDYCTACHGTDGTGAGSAVKFLKAPPPDLTTMAKRYNQKFIGLRVVSVLRFGTESKAHGALNMPTWGPLFRALDEGGLDHQVMNMRISNLAEYVESIQTK